MPGLLKNLRCHIPRRPTRRSQNMKSLLIHDSAQPKIRNQQVRVIFRRPEQKILRLQVSVNDAVVVQVSHRTQGRPDEVRGVGFVVAAFPADAVEELATEGEVGDEVDCC